MWDRKTLKEKGKRDFRANRFVCILAAFLLMTVGAIGGGGGGSTAASGASTALSSSARNNAYMYNSTELGNFEFKGVATEDNIDLDDIEGWEDEWTDEYDDFYDDYDIYADPYSGGLTNPDTLVLMTVLFIFIFLLIIVFVLLDIFIFNPAAVGLRKFFVANAKDHNAGLDRNTFGYAFYNGYKNIVGAMFVTDLFVFLLSLLLIIPGVIFGRYVWRFVPYILGENPNMKGSEARRMSSEIVHGHKWNIFVFDLSFIGWYLLAVVTLGISTLVWTAPYHAQSDAELYLVLTGRSDVSADPQQVYNAPQQETLVFDSEEEHIQPASEVAPQSFEAAPAVEEAKPAVEEAAPQVIETADTADTAVTAVTDDTMELPEDLYSGNSDADNVEDSYNY